MRIFLVTIACSLVLAACGYQLNGSGVHQRAVFSPLLKQISVEGLKQYDSMHHRLVSVLHTYGMHITSSERALSRIIMSNKREKDWPTVIGSDANVAEYSLSVSIDFMVKQAGGGKVKTLLERSTVRASASYLHHPDFILINQSARQKALENIEAEIASKIIHRLIAMSARLK